MRDQRLLHILIVSALTVVLACANLSAAHATTPDGDLSSCSVSITPHRVAPSSTPTYTVQVTNTDSSPIDWLRLLAPSTNYQIFSGDADGWFVSLNSEEIMLNSGQILPGATFTFTVTAGTGIIKTPVEYWELMASNGGSDFPIDCTGDTSSAIGLLGPPEVSNTSAFNLTSTSATIFWTTDRPAGSVIDYGRTNRYGSTKTGSEHTTSHTLQLSGLVPGASYHYRVSSTEGDVTGYGGDNTFTTASLTVPADTHLGPSSHTDTAPPTVTLTTSLKKSFISVPTIAGTAHDNHGIASLEYTTTSGRSWLPVADIHGPTYAFTPILPDDGDYGIQVRATDTAGNAATTPLATLTIDRLPPRFGPMQLRMGQQIISPDNTGTLRISSKTDHRLTISLVGGPTKVSLTATAPGVPQTSTFGFSQDLQSGLWSGTVSLGQPGRYQLTGSAVDGAGNSTKQLLATLWVLPPVHVLAPGGIPHGATATLFSLNPQTHTWSVWDSNAYDQPNPISIDSHGAFSLLAPPGTYYLRLLSGRTSVVTKIFSLSRATPFTGLIRFNAPALKLGPFTLNLPFSGLDNPPLPSSSPTAPTTPSWAGARLPLVHLLATSGRTVSPADWYGRPTVLGQFATWSPGSVSLLSAIEQLQSNLDINAIPVALQQPFETIAAYQKIAGYTGAVITDPDGLLSSTLASPSIPTFYFLDRHGTIKQAVPGPLSAPEITAILSKLQE